MMRRNSSSLISPCVPIRLVDHLRSSSSSCSAELAPASRFRNGCPSRRRRRAGGRQDLLRLSFSLIPPSSSEELREVDRAGPSLSCQIIFLISSFFGSKPSARIATFSSLASMVPSRPCRRGRTPRESPALLLLRRAPVVRAWRRHSRARLSQNPIAVGAQTVAGTRGPGRSGRGTPRRTVSSNFFDFCFFDILPVGTGSYGASFV